MPTPRQIEANRLNAQKSTGPRTEGGRAASSKNALKHGLTAEQITLKDEDPEDFEAFYAALYEELAPVGALEEMVVEEIVRNAWRCRRIPRLEIGLLNSMSTPISFLRADDLQQRMVSLAMLSRYEAGIVRALQQSRLQLERLQARRRGEAAAPPVAVAVSGQVEISHGAAPSDKVHTIDQAPGAPEHTVGVPDVPITKR